MKGIVSQAKQSGVRPLWIKDTLWAQMQVHWSTPRQKNRSQTYSNCRNSTRGGLGRHKHVAGQASYSQIQEEMEEELRRPVSFGEVFLRAHTKADGSFVDDEKAINISEAYKKTLQEREAELTAANLDPADQSTLRTLSIAEQNEIFLQCTTTDGRGGHFGLGSLAEVLAEEKEQEAAGFSASSLAELKSQLEAANHKLAEQAAENTRSDEEARASKTTVEMLLEYMKDKDPNHFAEFMARRSSATPIPATTHEQNSQ